MSGAVGIVGTIGSVTMVEAVGDGTGGTTNDIGGVPAVAGCAGISKGPGSVNAINMSSAGVLAASASRPNSDHVIDNWVSRSRVMKCGRF